MEAVGNLSEILEVKGIDAVICGPMDLSASAGKLGMLDDPEIRDLMEEIIGKCRSAKVPFGVSVGMDLPLARYWQSRGASMISVGTPYSFFRRSGTEVLGSSGGRQAVDE